MHSLLTVTVVQTGWICAEVLLYILVFPITFDFFFTTRQLRHLITLCKTGVSMKLGRLLRFIKYCHMNCIEGSNHEIESS